MAAATKTTRGRVPPAKGGTRYWDADLGRWMYKPRGRSNRAVAYHSPEGESARAADGATDVPFDAKRTLRRAGVATDRVIGDAARRTGSAGRGLLAEGVSSAGGPGIGSLIVYGAASLLGLLLLDTALTGRGPAAVDKLLGGLGQGIRKLVDPTDPIIGKGVATLPGPAAAAATTAAGATTRAAKSVGGAVSGLATPTGAPTHARGVELVDVISYAESQGLKVSENPFVGDPADPGVHVNGSYHYRTFPGSFGGKTLGRAIDVTGPAAGLASFFSWVKQFTPTELLYTPLGFYDLGRPFKPSADLAAAHTTHVHVAF